MQKTQKEKTKNKRNKKHLASVHI